MKTPDTNFPHWPERMLIPHFPSIVDIQCGEKAILL